MRRLFLNDEYEIYRNILDLNYLASVHANLSGCLLKRFKLERHIVCHLIFTEYEYTHVG